MKKKNPAKWIFLIIAIAINVFIIVNGFIDGGNSANESNRISKFLATILNFFSHDLINDSNFADFASVIRKLVGHFSLFLVDAIPTTLTFYFFYKEKSWYKFYYLIASTLLIGFVVACISELAQMVTPGRYGSWSDIGIDFAGYFLGAAVVILILFLTQLSKKSPTSIK